MSRTIQEREGKSIVQQVKSLNLRPDRLYTLDVSSGACGGPRNVLIIGENLVGYLTGYLTTWGDSDTDPIELSVRRARAA